MAHPPRTCNSCVGDGLRHGRLWWRRRWGRAEDGWGGWERGSNNVDGGVQCCACVSKIIIDIVFYVIDIPHSTRTIRGTNLIQWCQWEHLLEGIVEGLRVWVAGLKLFMVSIDSLLCRFCIGCSLSLNNNGTKLCTIGDIFGPSYSFWLVSHVWLPIHYIRYQSKNMWAQILYVSTIFQGILFLCTYSLTSTCSALRGNVSYDVCAP